MKNNIILAAVLYTLLFSVSCRKELPLPWLTTKDKPVADFTFSVSNEGQVPCKVVFTNTSANSNRFIWYFLETDRSTNKDEERTYYSPRTYSVTLVAINSIGRDSLTQVVTVAPIMKSVLAYLVTPKDKQFNERYYQAAKDALLDLQDWYKQQMGDNRTFVLNPLVVDTLTGLHDSAWYNSDNGSMSGTDPRYYAYYNTFYEMQQLLGNRFNISDYVYLVYVAAAGDGAGGTGFTAMGDQDLKGLLGENPDNLNPNRWIGGAGHELGHAFGLPHPANENGQAIMWTGYINYPDCILQQSDKDILNNGSFFR